MLRFLLIMLSVLFLHRIKMHKACFGDSVTKPTMWLGPSAPVYAALHIISVQGLSPPWEIWALFRRYFTAVLLSQTNSNTEFCIHDTARAQGKELQLMSYTYTLLFFWVLHSVSADQLSVCL